MSPDPETRPPPAAPKTPPPPLTARAPRPQAVRVRRAAAAVAILGASGLLAGAFAWAFVISPELRAEGRGRAEADRPEPSRGAVRPSEAVTDGPADYGEAGRLPPPRGPWGPDDAAAPPDPAAPPPPARLPDYAAPAPVPVASARRDPGPDPREAARRSALFFPAAPAAGDTGAGGEVTGAGRAVGPRTGVADPGRLLVPLSPYELKAGAVIPAALLNGVDTTRPGPVVATVTEAVFDTVSGRHLVVPQGSRLIGRHEGESRYGDRRAFLVWQRLILPNGKSLVLGDEAGVDAEGTVGLAGRVDRRLGSLALAVLAAGAVTTLGTVARRDGETGGGVLGDVGDAAAIEAAEVGGRLVGRELEVRPAIRLRPGTAVRVLLTRDLVLEPYRP